MAPEPTQAGRSWLDEMTEDDDWFGRKSREFESMDRDALLNEARTWAFNAQQWKREELAVRRWAGETTRDSRRALSRVGALVSVQKKTLPMDALRVALADCEFCGKPAQAIWRLHVFTCTACGAELEKQAAADAPPEASAAGAAPLPGMELT